LAAFFEHVVGVSPFLFSSASFEVEHVGLAFVAAEAECVPVFFDEEFACSWFDLCVAEVASCH
jgi:hypothetical protein